jgi:radical SAM superfamily enzyme YgiQ (UPF0313 family)
LKSIVSFVNPNFQIGPKHLNAHYLPYASGLLWSYCLTSPYVKENYALGEFIWQRDSIDVAVQKLKNSDVIGFSHYIWNKNYCYTLARELKKTNPDCKIIFGGPETPITQSQLFQKHPYIDIVVKNEGEKCFRAILENNDYSTIPGLLLNDNTKTVDTGPNVRIDELDCIPSPYLTGVFDDLISKNKAITWNVILETTRGCPYSCTFCDWGSLTYSKIKKFNLDRIFSELEWFGKNGFDHVIFADANFGILERDFLIADKLIEVQKKYSNPKTYSVSWAKNQKREVVSIVKKLIEHGGNNIGLNLSLQTLDAQVLKNIKRDNLAINHVHEVFNLCEKNDIPLYTELILGLPGETLESWKQNFYKLFEAGNHTGISVYQCELLENAEMNLLQKKLYKIDQVVVYDYMEGSNNEDELKESITLVKSTSSLNNEQMLDAQVWSWFITTFHINGISNWISRFLNKHKQISYNTFYEKLFDDLSKSNWLDKERSNIRDYYKIWMKDGAINYRTPSGIHIHGWNLIHSTLINLQYDDQLDNLYEFLYKFVLDFGLDKTIADELIEFQKNYVIKYQDIKIYPKIVKNHYDFFGYLKDGTSLTNPAAYSFEYTENKELTFQQYCENLFFSRRKNFGKARIKAIKEIVDTNTNLM